MSQILPLETGSHVPNVLMTDRWERDYCLAGDKVGVTLSEATKMAHRAARWSAASSLLAKLAPWFGDIAERLQDL